MESHFGFSGAGDVKWLDYKNTHKRQYKTDKQERKSST